MLLAIVVLLFMPILDLGRLRGSQHRPILRFIMVGLAAAFIILLQLGALHVEAPFVVVGQIISIFYFSWFVILLPFSSILENTLADSSNN